jgi:hypothetical protein
MGYSTLNNSKLKPACKSGSFALNFDRRKKYKPVITEEVVKTAKKKLELLLEVLADYEWHWGEELAVTVSWRFGATIKEARNKGYEIETERVGIQSRYRLLRS